MQCKKCGSEQIVKNGSRRGKPCFLCKNCKHQFTSEKVKYTNCDKYIAIFLYKNNTRWKKTNPFINSELRLTHIAKILNCKYSTVYSWIYNNIELKLDPPERQAVLNYIKSHKNRADIYGLLCPNKVHYPPSKKLQDIIKHKQ